MITARSVDGLKMREANLPLHTQAKEGCETTKSENAVYQSTGNQEFVTISIVSPDPMIRTFLHGILSFQGYQCEVNLELQEFLSEKFPFPKEIVFLDEAYVMGIELDAVRYRLQELVQAGGKLVVLTGRWLEADLARVLNPGKFQMVWKPLDYRQIGQAMAQIGFGIGEV